VTAIGEDTVTWPASGPTQECPRTKAAATRDLGVWEIFNAVLNSRIRRYDKFTFADF
jgi:hypothetical protein